MDCESRRIVAAPTKCIFATLSYVCGTASYKSQATSDALRKGVKPDDVPQTISDAIQVVLQLQLRYLWVDQYCIDQFDEATLQQQMSVMDMVYNRATVTIIAACGEDASFGLPGVGPHARVEQPTINLEGRTWISSLESPRRAIESSKRLASCWTYQEGLSLGAVWFSPRIRFISSATTFVVWRRLILICTVRPTIWSCDPEGCGQVDLAAITAGLISTSRSTQKEASPSKVISSMHCAVFYGLLEHADTDTTLLGHTYGL